MTDIIVSGGDSKKPNDSNKKSANFNLLNKINKKYLIIGILIILLATGGWLGYQKYDELKQENARLSNPEEVVKQENELLKEQVAKHIEVPKDEVPTIATVVDASKLKNQAFFKNAENGDKVLIFAQAKKAILYRQSTDKIIEVAPINIGDEDQQNQDQPVQ